MQKKSTLFFAIIATIKAQLYKVVIKLKKKKSYLPQLKVTNFLVICNIQSMLKVCFRIADAHCMFVIFFNFNLKESGWFT